MVKELTLDEAIYSVNKALSIVDGYQLISKETVMSVLVNLRCDIYVLEKDGKLQAEPVIDALSVVIHFRSIEAEKSHF